MFPPLPFQSYSHPSFIELHFVASARQRKNFLYFNEERMNGETF
uniref:ABC transporter B family member 26ic isoform X2 n=1 Tax=Rhizophora mucronata TaxID=61149 RepID=A0A2P2LW28_RHIMU